MNRSGVIYKITNKINGKIYIGQTVDVLSRRFKRHLSNAKRGDGGCWKLYNAIKKYSFENFICEEIDRADNLQTLCQKEICWISFYQSTRPEYGYNILIGGSLSRFGTRATPETRRKMSESHSGARSYAYNNPEVKERCRLLGLSSRGRRYSLEVRQRRSEAQRGDKNPFWGRKHSDEVKEFLSRINTGSNHPRFGTHHSEKTIKLMSDVQMGSKNAMYKHAVSNETLYDLRFAKKMTYQQIIDHLMATVGTSISHRALARRMRIIEKEYNLDANSCRIQYS